LITPNPLKTMYKIYRELIPVNESVGYSHLFCLIHKVGSTTYSTGYSMINTCDLKHIFYKHKMKIEEYKKRLGRAL
jgi:hypothetical protein